MTRITGKQKVTFSRRIPGSQDWSVLEFTPGGASNDPFHALPVKLEPLLRQRGLRAREFSRRLLPGEPQRRPRFSYVEFVSHPCLNHCPLFAAQKQRGDAKEEAGFRIFLSISTMRRIRMEGLAFHV
jgi:hypothetical protein